MNDLKVNQGLCVEYSNRKRNTLYFSVEAKLRSTGASRQSTDAFRQPSRPGGTLGERLRPQQVPAPWPSVVLRELRDKALRGLNGHRPRLVAPGVPTGIGAFR
jgi:hypothetical protein